MTHQTFFGSLARISDLPHTPFDVEPLARDHWDTGDYVVCEVASAPGPLNHLELTNGRMVDLFPGDRIVGAFGERRATLEAVGDWQSIGDDGAMHALTSAGLIGKLTSASPLLPSLMSLRYEGHASRGGSKLTMKQFVVPQTGSEIKRTPIVLLLGTSMSCGKTTAARVIVHQLRRAGLRVAGAKLTGAGRYRDILAMQDAGASTILDFVDEGMPSTVCDPAVYREALTSMLIRLDDADPDVIVAEAGASPLEPYNGQVVVDMLGSWVQCTVLCASDPYAVVGAVQGHGLTPDLVTGIATTTSAGIELIRRLTGIKALNVLDRWAMPDLNRHLLRRLGHLGDGLDIAVP